FEAQEHADGGGLAGAVAAEEGEGLAGADGEADAAEDGSGAERLGDAVEGDGGLRVGGGFPGGHLRLPSEEVGGAMSSWPSGSGCVARASSRSWRMASASRPSMRPRRTIWRSSSARCL